MGAKTVARSRAHLLIVLTALLAASCALIALEAQPAYALKVSGGAKVHNLRSCGTYNYDITGDGIPDTIETDYDVDWDAGAVTGIRVTINGKQAWYKSIEPSLLDNFAYDDWTIQLITLANKKPLLFVKTYVFGVTPEICTILTYQKGRLKSILKPDAICSSRYLYGSTDVSVCKVSGNTITFDYWLKVMMTGCTTFNASYKYKAGKLVRTSSYVKPRIGGKYGKSRTALKNLSAYKNASCKSKKFIIKKGQKVKLLKMYVKGSKMALQVKVGKKTGWVKCAASMQSKLLVGQGEPPFKGLEWAG